MNWLERKDISTLLVTDQVRWPVHSGGREETGGVLIGEQARPVPQLI